MTERVRFAVEVGDSAIFEITCVQKDGIVVVDEIVANGVRVTHAEASAGHLDLEFVRNYAEAVFGGTGDDFLATRVN